MLVAKFTLISFRVRLNSAGCLFALFMGDSANCTEVNIRTHEGGDKYMSVSRNQSDAIVWSGICLLLIHNLLQWVV